MASTKITEYDMEDSVFSGIMTKLEELSAKLDAMPAGTVKHIQNGTVRIEKGSKSATVALSGFSDLSKMVAIINGSLQESSYFTNAIYLSSLTLTELTVASDYNANYSGVASYQVIEYY